MFPTMPLFIAFLAASFLLAVTPGPGVFYIVSRALAEGRRAGMASVLGVAAGNFGNAVIAALGLAAVFAVFSFAWLVVKYAGAAYLAYLGIRALMRARVAGDAVPPAPAAAGRIFRDGLLVALTNPKTALFFAAFLPQFINSAGSVMLQSLVLGGLFVAIALCTDTLYALAAGTLAPLFVRRQRTQVIANLASGILLLGLAVLTALTSRRPPLTNSP